MKTTSIISSLVILILTGCTNNIDQNGKREKEQTETEMTNEVIDMILAINSEKIALITVMYNVQLTITESILRDYLFLKYTVRLKDKSFTKSSKIIDDISQIAEKHNLSKRLTASIIFTYKFETNKGEFMNYEDEDYYEYDPYSN